MKKLLLILLGTLISLPAFARDFEYTYEGQTLTYTVLNEETKTCEVAHNSVSGKVVIPSLTKDGDVEYSVTSIGERAFSSCSGLTSVIIPTSVTSISDLAFYYCSGLTSVTIPNSVTSIGYAAFYHCRGLTSVNIPNSVTSIGTNAFYCCRGLTSVNIPNSVTSIGNRAFEGCSALTSVTIPTSVTSIGYEAFGNCTALTSIEVTQENPNYASLDGVLFNKDLSTLIQFPAGRTGDYGIPASVTSIGYSAFKDCSGLTSVDIPTSVTSIGDEAFCYCSGLTSVTIPNSVTSICKGTFWGCSGLTSIEIPNSITSIGNSAFRGCSRLTSVNIPNSLTSIGERAFYMCLGLTSVNIPNSVTSIGECAFYWCLGLTSVTISNTVASIGSQAFWGCPLNSVYYLADEPIKGEKDTFDDSTYKGATLYMTEVGTEKGRTIGPWKKFTKIEVYDSDGIEAIDAEIDFNQPCEVYSLSGAKVGNTTENLVPGIYIVRQGNAVKKIVVKKI